MICNALLKYLSSIDLTGTQHRNICEIYSYSAAMIRTSQDID